MDAISYKWWRRGELKYDGVLILCKLLISLAAYTALPAPVAFGCYNLATKMLVGGARAAHTRSSLLSRNNALDPLHISLSAAGVYHSKIGLRFRYFVPPIRSCNLRLA